MFRKGIDIKPYLKYYIVKKNDKIEVDLNDYSNTVICTSYVYNRLPIKKDNKGNLTLNFNDLISIRDREDFSNKILKKYWGASMANDNIINVNKDGNNYIINFDTMYLPPIGIINYLLMKYKKEIIWHSKNKVNKEERGRLYYYDKKEVITLIEKKKTKKEKEEEKNNNFHLEYFIPYHAVYYGLYINAYAKSSKDEKYICSCYKEAIKNKLIMFEDYLQYDYCLNDRIELLLKFLGLPDYYEEKIKNKGKVDNYLDYLEVFNFEDKLCPICNGAKIKELPFYMNNGESKFKQKYIGEMEKRYAINGIVYPIHVSRGNYFNEKLLSEDNKKILLISDDELLKEIRKYDLDIDLDKEFNKFIKLPEIDKNSLKYSLIYNKNGFFDSFKYLEEHNINIDFIDIIQDIFNKKFKSIMKNINNEIKEFDKTAIDNREVIDPTGGLFIVLFADDTKKNFIQIILFTDVIIINEYKNNKLYLNEEYESNINIFGDIMEIISSYRLSLIADNNKYTSFIIHNGTGEFTEKDGLYSDYASVGINHALIYLMSNIDSKDKINIKDILSNWI